MLALNPCRSRASLSVMALALFAAGCSRKQARPPRPTATVAVVPARRASVPYMIEANGVVQPLQSVAVASQVDGIVSAVDFQEGQDVHAGQVLFQIDPRPYRAAYEQALAVLARDSATAANAKAEYGRYEKLLQSRVVTPEEGEQFRTTAAASDATVRADRAAVANARFNLDNTTIRAPIAGKTGSLLVKRGNLVRAGTSTPLVVINQVRPILVRFAIPSSQLPLLLQYGAAGGLPVAAVPGGLAPASAPIDSTTAAGLTPVGDPPGQGAPGNGAANGAMSPLLQQGLVSHQRVMGRLSFIDNAVDTTTGTVQLKATFDNTAGTLWAGEFAATSLHLFDENGALVVPGEAVVTGQRGTYVYVVDQSDTARQRPVTVERVAQGLAVIADGLRDGERVVTEGQSRLTPDAAVRIRSAADLAEPAVAARRG
ncbi:MAG TPA: efflux RND transporter periplasmic adaptor subunit, partial [Gemmatimonadaceae bacterium]|nr:efflux RND transporter periplasmic adaptor subunit [Gemmatimonadaceae bacterium]